jgi:hypothetical protein
MMVRLLLAPPQKPFGMTLAATARQKADTWAVEQAMSMKHIFSSASPSVVLLQTP